jgi:hypothetical protein
MSRNTDRFPDNARAGGAAFGPLRMCRFDLEWTVDLIVLPF